MVEGRIEEIVEERTGPHGARIPFNLAAMI
jgi:hypothetical protein